MFVPPQGSAGAGAIRLPARNSASAQTPFGTKAPMIIYAYAPKHKRANADLPEPSVTVSFGQPTTEPGP